jgi:hypothetical protein
MSQSTRSKAMRSRADAAVAEDAARSAAVLVHAASPSGASELGTDAGLPGDRAEKPPW